MPSVHFWKNSWAGGFEGRNTDKSWRLLYRRMWRLLGLFLLLFFISKFHKWAGDAVTEKSRMTYNWDAELQVQSKTSANNFACVSTTWLHGTACLSFCITKQQSIALSLSVVYFNVLKCAFCLQVMERSEDCISPMPHVNSCFSVHLWQKK